MRPVDKGEAPRTYANYQDAGPDLQTRLGEYCSYCERKLATHLAVEHIQPKSLVPTLATAWSNFLLGCVHCNSSKGDIPIQLPDYLWPDTDNTLRAIGYSRGGLVSPSPSLSPSLHAKANATIALTGLDKYPGNPGRTPTLSDKRWLHRKEAWQYATSALTRLQAQPGNTGMREQIVETAIAAGFFSIWWTVFAGDADMRRRFRAAFPGTDSSSFDAQENCQYRPGGQV